MMEDMNGLKIFENKEFGQIRTVTIDGEPWFVGKDVAIALGYKDTKNALKDHVDSEDKRGWQIATPGGDQTMTTINESGLYSLIFGSKLESAKRFKHWVTSEVLPSIRKNGVYSMDGKVERFIEQQVEFNRMVMERLASNGRDETASPKVAVNPFEPGMADISERMKNLNRLVNQTSEFCGMERNKVLHYMYLTVQEKANVSLKSYLNVFQSETRDDSLCNLHVICMVDRLYDLAVEMNEDVIGRKMIYG